MIRTLALALVLQVLSPHQVFNGYAITSPPLQVYKVLPTGVNFALGSSPAQNYSIGASGTWTLVPISGTQPAGNVPTWSSSCACVTLVVATNGMSATYKVLATATVGQSVTISAVAPPYPDGSAGGSAQISFGILANPYPVAGYTIVATP